MTMTDEGHFIEYQLSTGAVRRRGQLRVPRVESAQQSLSLRVLRDRVVIRAASYVSPEPLEAAISYDRASLEPLPFSRLDLLTFAADCGPVLCGTGRERTYIFDKETRAELWHTIPGEYASWTSAGLLLMLPQSQRLVDERTGQTRVEVQGWRPTLQGSGMSVQKAPTVMTRRIDDRTHVARLTPQGLRMLGSIPRGLRNCELNDALLLCQNDEGQTEIWRGSRM
jgi:hypothetical protein